MYRSSLRRRDGRHPRPSPPPPRGGVRLFFHNACSINCWQAIRKTSAPNNDMGDHRNKTGGGQGGVVELKTCDEGTAAVWTVDFGVRAYFIRTESHK